MAFVETSKRIFSRQAWRLAFVTVLLAMTALQIAEAKDLKGVALIIGQSKYEHIAALPNPANDARDIAKMLTDLGFDARNVSDRDAAKLKRDLERFTEDAEGADVAFIYYSGHGIEAGGENYLVPVDADLSSLKDADSALVPISAVMDELKKTVPVTIVLLDACRTNPFPADAVVRRAPTASAEPIGAGGLEPVRGAKALANSSAQEDASLGTVVGFAAEPGRPALDGAAGENSPYASALLRHLAAMKGTEFGSVMRMVTEEVYLDTKAKQRPWVNESLRRLLYFGVAPPDPTGDDGLITGERRQLLLTISDLPDPKRAQVELASLQDGVPMDALYGVLRAMGTDKIPEDPTDLQKVLRAQSDRLKKMMSERAALRTDDPEIKRLVASADKAIGQGAIVTARKFLDDAVGRIEQTGDAVDDAEELVKRKRLADAAIYARRADASALVFDYKAAAKDYGKAFSLAEKWDDRLRWNYKNQEAEALNAYGDASGDLDALQQAIEAYRAILNFIPNGEQNRDWAITRNNMAVVLQTIGERETETAHLEEAAQIFRDSLAVFERDKDDRNWAAAQNNLANVLLKIGERESDPKRLNEAVAAMRATLDKRPRDKLPLDWAASQMNLGLVLYARSERDPAGEHLAQAEAAYRLALQEYTREKTPVEWAMVENNLGNTLVSLGLQLNDKAKINEASDAFRAALEIRTRDTFPVSWASSRLNLGNALSGAARFDMGTGALEEAAAAYDDALTVFTRQRFPMDWASAQNNLGSVYQTIGQRTRDAAKLEQSAAAFQAARQVYVRRKFPQDWAMSYYNLGNTLQLLGGVTDKPEHYIDAVAAYRDALREYKRETNPRQWALTQAGLGSTLHWLSMSNGDPKTLQESIAARRAALEVLTMETAPVDWANAQNGIGMSLLNLGNLQRTGKYLDEAQAAFTATLKVFTRESQPMQWAFEQNNLGDVSWNRASYGGGKAEYLKAIEFFENAKQGFTEAGYTMPIPLTDQKIDLVKKQIAKN
ncbi:MAG: tetratricopeptide repeat protein [Mesorhizobium sp.]|nr:tetratricopeptide repeat protein [bacterium M00.F.Ca.ET.205.01.1.1]TGU53118.1 tetratricopeptide repeat protein [bacterium M00.F.Ca.ET.152.01.1.1]TGV36085.1 tetratricopeptide repeat protein [Mesorhizobium sp. M00.F.Ca.ET.186.01.1.1]TGZ43671.1 tetratricopeptide repeat protein [bacterium M00.F.Ca.ET.162.01.1.1]TJW31526.1 MAG: tetratricopeptide repeat protein [Mesorhizobium sp.]